ncbi:hypothetical protein B0T24DRAFT_233784 [Lasiosphaeria ovina]|uniref:Uncharacterized protein n=1 Tax=Lasiosphaeria ovina TaxID=92902 RepID=A0AAE0NB67_9PEZI|nr:hypothetical protein B0T24DRAFT_233784 [Lasiosphaeria ovina]
MATPFLGWMDAPELCGLSDTVGYIEPDPDIAGIGVLASFLVTGALVMVLATVQLYRNWLDGDFAFARMLVPCPDPLIPPAPAAAAGPARKWPTLDDARKYLDDSDGEQPPPPQGDADEDGDPAAWEPKGSHAVAAPQLPPPSALQATLFSLADTQFATGIAVCVAAIVKKDITQAHYLVADEMAWLAWLTSTAGMLTARTALLDAGNGPVKRAVRLAVMWALVALVSFIEVRRDDRLYFAEQVYTGEGPYWDLTEADSRASVVLFALSLVGAVIDTASLFPHCAVLMYYYVELFVGWAAPPVGTTCKGTAEALRKRAWVAAVGGVASLLLQLLVWTPVWLAVSMLYLYLFFPATAHLANMFWFVYQTWYAFHWRDIGRSCQAPEDAGNEDEFGFGQVVALTLLISPLIANADLWWDACKGYMRRRAAHAGSTPTWEVDSRDSVSTEKE